MATSNTFFTLAGSTARRSPNPWPLHAFQWITPTRPSSARAFAIALRIATGSPASAGKPEAVMPLAVSASTPVVNRASIVDFGDAPGEQLVPSFGPVAELSGARMQTFIAP